MKINIVLMTFIDEYCCHICNCHVCEKHVLIVRNCVCVCGGGGVVVGGRGLRDVLGKEHNFVLY